MPPLIPNESRGEYLRSIFGNCHGAHGAALVIFEAMLNIAERMLKYAKATLEPGIHAWPGTVCAASIRIGFGALRLAN